jgi:serine/threonine protein kinase
VTADQYVLLTKFGGQNLFDYVNTQPLISETTLKPIAKAMFLALAHCHCQGICHSDVKLENFVISKHERVRLLDFGLAERIGDGVSNSPCGSTFYRPPELILERPHNTKIDVWALAISLFALATREFPFSAEDEYCHIIEVLSEPADLSALDGRYGKDFQELIRSMLSKNPDQRPTIEECLQSNWFTES